MSITTNITTSWYHSLLRVSVLVFAFALVFESGIFSSATSSIVHVSGQQFANTISATLDSATYTDEGSSINQPESTGLSGSANYSTDALSKTTFLLSTLVFVLLLLIILNYILDFLRSRELHHRLAQKQQ